MTPTDIENMARSKYSAVGDTFFTQMEVQYLIYQAQLELANECNIIENIYTTTTTAGTRQYAYPSQARIIKRVEYINLLGAGSKLEPITFREDDALTLTNVASLTMGTPTFYTIFNYSLYLRPIPDTSACTIKVYSFNEPQLVTTASVIDVPSNFHMDIVDFVVMHMYLKDKDSEMAKCYAELWLTAKTRAKRFVEKRKRGDGYTVTQNEDSLAVTLLGPV